MNKYRNKPVTIGGVRFASQAEARRHDELKLLEEAGEIAALQCQPSYPLFVAGHKVCTYRGDFYYRERDPKLDMARLHEVVEDVKGCETPVFKIKAKLFRALHPTIELRVISSGKGSKRITEEQLRAIESRRTASSSGM